MCIWSPLALHGRRRSARCGVASSFISYPLDHAACVTICCSICRGSYNYMGGMHPLGQRVDGPDSSQRASCRSRLRGAGLVMGVLPAPAAGGMSFNSPPVTGAAAPCLWASQPTTRCPRAAFTSSTIRAGDHGALCRSGGPLLGLQGPSTIIPSHPGRAPSRTTTCIVSGRFLLCGVGSVGAPGGGL